jgi:hypothetical protein
MPELFQSVPKCSIRQRVVASEGSRPGRGAGEVFFSTLSRHRTKGKADLLAGQSVEPQDRNGTRPILYRPRPDFWADNTRDISATLRRLLLLIHVLGMIKPKVRDAIVNSNFGRDGARVQILPNLLERRTTHRSPRRLSAQTPASPALSTILRMQDARASAQSGFRQTWLDHQDRRQGAR